MSANARVAHDRGSSHLPDGVVEATNPHEYGLVKVAYSVNETLNLLSIGRTSLYKLVARGVLRPAKLGKKTLFYASDIAALLTKLREAG
jgi:excisionase family DNA binding protein